MGHGQQTGAGLDGGACAIPSRQKKEKKYLMCCMHKIVRAAHCVRSRVRMRGVIKRAISWIWMRHDVDLFLPLNELPCGLGCPIRRPVCRVDLPAFSPARDMCIANQRIPHTMIMSYSCMGVQVCSHLRHFLSTAEAETFWFSWYNRYSSISTPCFRRRRSFTER